MRVGKTFTFEAAHIIEGHPTCGRVHGHTWTLEVMLRGRYGSNGMIIDFKLLGGVVKDLLNTKLDHKMLNETVDITPLTCETLVEWITAEIDRRLHILCDDDITRNIDTLQCKLQEGTGGWAECTVIL
jgi:6-pyruvoyltetrahydropterin/6-carboxytetrahydropterin synthase